MNDQLRDAAPDLAESLLAIWTQYKRFELEPDDPAQKLREQFWGAKMRAAEQALRKAGKIV